MIAGLPTTLATAAATLEVTLTWQGGIIMALCVTLVLGLMTFCLSKVLRESRCPQCGEPLRSGSQFCQDCGHER